MSDDYGVADPRKPTQIAIVGRKGSGKTELAFLYFDSYPGDRAAVDMNGDLKMPPDTMLIESPVPARWPGEAYERLYGKKKRQTLHFIPDVTTPDYLEEIDRFVGMCFARGHVCLFIDECQVAAPAGRTPPHMRRALWQGRHSPLTQIDTSPRPVTVDTLVIDQADLVGIFDLPSPKDRKRVADGIGWNPQDFNDAVEALPEYGFLLYDRSKKDLAEYPPLPASLIRHHQAAGT